MGRILFTLILFFCVNFLFAQSVSYNYRPLAAKGCQVKFTPNWQEGTPYLIVSVTSDRMKYIANPVIMFKTTNSEIIKIEGISLDVSTSSAGMVVGNIVLPIQEFTATVQFPITEEQIEMLNQGIAKVKISMVPINHERTFSKDKIGKKLYKAFQKTKQTADNF